MVDRVILGRGRNTGGSDWGLWVSNPGFDVKTCDEANLAFDSESFGYAQLMGTGTLTIAAGSFQDITVRCPANTHVAVFYRVSAIGFSFACNSNAAMTTGTFISTEPTITQTFPTSTQCRTRFTNPLGSSLYLTYMIASIHE